MERADVGEGTSPAQAANEGAHDGDDEEERSEQSTREIYSKRRVRVALESSRIARSWPNREWACSARFGNGQGRSRELHVFI